MSGEKLKALEAGLNIEHVVYSVEPGTTFPADERMLVERFRSTSHGAAYGFMLKEIRNYTGLTILKVYS